MMHIRLLQAAVFWLSLLLLQSTHAISPEQLEVKLNTDLLKSKQLIFGTIVQIKDLHSWSDENIVHLAYVAHGARRAAFDDSEKKIQKALKTRAVLSKLPKVTTTLIIDDVAYISTSMKGGPFLYSIRHDQAPHWRRADLVNSNCVDLVEKGLTACQVTANPGSGHRTGANCGEVFALQSFCKSGSQEDVKNKLANAKIIAIRDVDDPDSREVIGMQIAKPCTGTATEWGCQDFLLGVGVKIGNIIQPNTGDEEKKVAAEDISVWPASV